MSWKTLTIKTDNALAEQLSQALLELGALSVEIHDAAAGTADEQPLYGEPGEPVDQLWLQTEVSGLFQDTLDSTAVMQTLVDAFQLRKSPDYYVETVEEQDWVRLTQSQFDPIRISQRLWIVPTWHASPDPAAINLILDPGLAFGTGSHPTTQLCLSWLDRHLQPGESLLDYGCGSGILAIAALKLGASHVTGIDIDTQAIEASRANALLNSCDLACCSFATAYAPVESGAEHAEVNAQFDVVVANILSNPLILLAPILARATRRGGRIALSGILREQAQEVTTVYRQWFTIQAAEAQEDWVLLTGVRQ